MTNQERRVEIVGLAAKRRQYSLDEKPQMTEEAFRSWVAAACRIPQTWPLALVDRIFMRVSSIETHGRSRISARIIAGKVESNESK